MFARSLSRAVKRAVAPTQRGDPRFARAQIERAVCNFSTSKTCARQAPLDHSKFHLPLLARLAQQKTSNGHRHKSSRIHLSKKDKENDVDVTPIGDKPGQITAEAVAEAEAAEPLADDDVGQLDLKQGDPSDWEFDESTERGTGAGLEGEDDDYYTPPTPILDAYEKSRDPAEMERLIQMSFDSLPERAGPQRYNHKRREKQRFKTIRAIKLKEKTQRMAAYERKLQKRRDRKAREAALFATWRGPNGSASASAQQ